MNIAHGLSFNILHPCYISDTFMTYMMHSFEAWTKTTLDLDWIVSFLLWQRLDCLFSDLCLIVSCSGMETVYGKHCLRILVNCKLHYTLLQNKRWRWCPSTPPIIFEGRNWPQQTIYRWKGNLMASRIHFKYWKNILISRLYEQFSRKDSAMALEKNFKLLKYEHII